MKALFRKLGGIRKRPIVKKARPIIKKAIGSGVGFWAFKYGPMNSNPVPRPVNSNQSIERLNGNYLEEKNDIASYDRSLTDNSSRFKIKIGSGAILGIRNNIRNKQNQKSGETETNVSSVKPSEILQSTLEIRSGDLGKFSSPGGKARNDLRNAKVNRPKVTKGGKPKPGKGIFAEAWLQNPSHRSRPRGVNHLAQQFQSGQSEGDNGLFGRFSPPPPLDPTNPGCSRGPRSITVRSSQQSQSEYQPDGYSEEQIAMFEKNPRYSELTKDPQLIGQGRETNPKSEEEACTILQAENEGLVRGARRTDLKAGDPNYDFRTDTPTRFAEIKVPRDASLQDAARLGRKAGLQRGNDGDVTILANLMRLRPEKRAPYAKVFLEAAGGDGVIFINT